RNLDLRMGADKGPGGGRTVPGLPVVTGGSSGERSVPLVTGGGQGSRGDAFRRAVRFVIEAGEIAAYFTCLTRGDRGELARKVASYAIDAVLPGMPPVLHVFGSN